MLKRLPKNWQTSDFLQQQKNKFKAKYLKRTVVIGKGSFGTVYLGSLKRDESEKVAIKVCKCRDDGDDMPEKRATTFIDNALTEVAIWSKVQASPFILDLIDCFVIKNNACNKNHPAPSLYIIMPFVPRDLEEYIVKDCFNAGLLFKTVCVVAIQLLLAVKYMHDMGIAHLDIKPDNIVVVLGPDKEFVKLLLIDFGCAKSFGNSKTLQASTSVGSPFFVAPEVKQGRYGLNMPEADVYSIGKTLLVCILGYNPQNVENKTPAEWIATWKVPPASQNSELVQISNKLISQKPQDRASLDDALTDFAGVFGDDSTGEIRGFNLAVKQLLDRNHRLGFVGRCLPSSGKLTSSQLRVVFKPALLNAPEVQYDITYTRHVPPSRNTAFEVDENSDPTTGAAMASKNGTGNDKRPAAAYHLRRN